MEVTLSNTRVRLHEGVIQYVETELASGRLTVGGRLPAERMLAQQLGVSRASVREGLRILEAMGIIRTAVGSGPESGAIVTADAPAGITAALRLHLASSNLPVVDIVETRTLLESWSARYAAARPDDPLLDDAAQLLYEMGAPRLSPEQFLELDTDFHVTLARAAGNDVITAIMTSLRGSIHSYVVASVPTLPDWQAMRRRLAHQHQNILKAVQEGDGERAARLVTAHVRGFFAATVRAQRALTAQPNEQQQHTDRP